MPLPPDIEKKALELALGAVSSHPRKLESWRRSLILDECFEPLVVTKVCSTHVDADTKRNLCKWVDVAMNVALDMADQICVVWDKPATRHIGLEPTELPEEKEPPEMGERPPGEPAEPQEGQEDDQEEQDGPPRPPALNGLPIPKAKPKPAPKPNPQTEALRKIYRDELKFDTWSQDLNKRAWFLTEAVVVPRIVKGKFRPPTILLPHFYDWIDDPKDPDGPPLAIVYKLRAKDESWVDQILSDSYPMRRGSVVILDDQEWRIYDDGATEPTQKIKHGLGYVPAVPLRFSYPLNGERFGDYRKHRRLMDATIDVALINTQLPYVRKAQNRKLAVAIGEMEKGDDGPTPDPESGVAISADPRQLLFGVHDFNTSPETFIQHASWIISQVAKSYGGESKDTQGLGGTIASRVEFSFEAQTEVRVDQINFARDFERQLAKVVCDMAKKAGHELADDLPDAEELEEKFSVQFAPLSRKFSTFAEEKEWLEFQKANGLASHFDFARRQDPDLSEEQARDFVLRKLEEAAEVNDIAASRNLPMDGESGMKSLSQVIGKTGPEARDNPSNRPPDSGQDEK